MDRIDTSLLSKLSLTPAAKTGGARQVDPTPRLRVVDRQDSVEFAGAGRAADVATAAPVAKIQPISSLVAGTVRQAGSASAAANAAMRMYSSPGEQNAAATRIASNAGSMLDVTG